MRDRLGTTSVSYPVRGGRMESEDPTQGQKARKHQSLVLWSTPIAVSITVLVYNLLGPVPALVACFAVLGAIYIPLLLAGRTRRGHPSASNSEPDL